MSILNTNFFCSYNVISKLFMKFGLTMEHGKMEMFHFSRLHDIFNSPPFDFTLLGGSVLHPKNTWYYLSLIFNHKLLFWQHIEFYTNKAISTIKYMKRLGNLSKGLSSVQKRRLYRYCTLPIALYGF